MKAQGTIVGSDTRVAGAVGRVALYGTLLVPLCYLPVYFPAVVPRTVLFRLLAAVAIGAAGYVWLSSRRSAALPRLGPVVVGLIAVISAGVITSLTGSSFLHSLLGEVERMWGVLGWAALLAFYAAGRGLFVWSDWRRLMTGHVLVAALVALHAITWTLFPEAVPAVTTRGGPSGVLGNPAYVGAYLLVALCGSLILIRGAERPWLRWFLIGVGVLFVWAILTTGNRAVLGALVVGVVAGGGSYSVRSGTRCRIAFTGVAAGLIAAAVIVLAFPTSIQEMLGVVPGAGRLSAEVWGLGMIDDRLMAWRAGLESFTAHPLLGIGPENFGVAFDRHFNPEWLGRTGRQPWDRAHNAFLEPFVAGGILGGVAYLTLWAGIGVLLFKQARSERLDTVQWSVLVGAVVAYGTYLFFFFEDISSLPVLFVLLGWAGSRERVDGEAFESTSSGSWLGWRARAVVALVITTAVVGFALFQLDYLSAARQVTLARKAGPLAEKVEHYTRAADARLPGEEEIPSAYASMVGTELPGAMRDLPRSEWPEQLLRRSTREARNAIARAIDWNPEQTRLRVHYASVLLTSHLVEPNADYLKRAVEQTRRAIRDAPNRITYYHMLSDLYRIGGAHEPALEAAEEGLRRYGELPGTYLRLARASHALGRPKRAYQALLGAARRGTSLSDRSLAEGILGATPETGRAARRDSLCAYLDTDTSGLCGED